MRVAPIAEYENPAVKTSVVSITLKERILFSPLVSHQLSMNEAGIFLPTVDPFGLLHAPQWSAIDAKLTFWPDKYRANFVQKVFAGSSINPTRQSPPVAPSALLNFQGREQCPAKAHRNR
jgi:hypothetical protein